VRPDAYLIVAAGQGPHAPTPAGVAEIAECAIAAGDEIERLRARTATRWRPLGREKFGSFVRLLTAQIDRPTAGASHGEATRRPRRTRTLPRDSRPAGRTYRRARHAGARAIGSEELPGRRAAATINEMKEAPMRVTLTEPEIAGDYLVEPQEDGTLILVPEGKEPTLAQIREREGARALSDEEFQRTFGELPSDQEG
jgi:hypothetical protein